MDSLLAKILCEISFNYYTSSSLYHGLREDLKLKTKNDKNINLLQFINSISDEPFFKDSITKKIISNHKVINRPIYLNEFAAVRNRTF